MQSWSLQKGELNVDNMTFGQRLEYTMTNRKRRKRELANSIGYDASSMTKWCSDESEPRLSAIQGLCKELKCSADWLLFGKR